MAETARQRQRRHALLIALACGALYAALIIAFFGLASLVTATDVVSEPHLSTMVGPTMVLMSVLVLTLMLALRGPHDNDNWIDWGYSLLTGIAAMAAYVATAFVGGIVDKGVDAGVHFGSVTLLGGYDVLVGVLGLLVALLYSFLIARRYDERGRPRWTWEDEFDA
ncbi:MAG: hypothetical protein ACOYBP_04315 [Microbacteriaceae bacterium]